MTEEKIPGIVPACRRCVHKGMCRWFPEVPANLVIIDTKHKGTMQIVLEKLFAEYCFWYERRRGET